MNFVIIFSNNWLPYVVVQLDAIWRHSPGKLNFFLVCDGLNTQEQAYLDRIVRASGSHKRIRINVIDAQAYYAQRIRSSINVIPNFTKYTLYRLLLPSILPLELNKVLYLDADTLVAGDIRPFYDTSLRRNLLAAVIDNGTLERKTELGFSHDEYYFNAGVLLMNLKEIRESELESQWLEHVNARHYMWPDQDILNITCKGRVSFVNPIYNTFGPHSPIKNPKIIHYTVQKPWSNKTVPRFDRWQKARADFDSKYLKIPKILNIIDFEPRDIPRYVANNREVNTRILADFQIRVWCKADLHIDASPYLRYLMERKEFGVLWQILARQITQSYGGIFVHDEVRLTQPIDHLLAYERFFAYESARHPYRCVMGTIPGQAIPNSPPTPSEQNKICFVNGNISHFAQVNTAKSWLHETLMKISPKCKR